MSWIFWGFMARSPICIVWVVFWVIWRYWWIFSCTSPMIFRCVGVWGWFRSDWSWFRIVCVLFGFVSSWVVFWFGVWRVIVLFWGSMVR